MKNKKKLIISNNQAVYDLFNSRHSIIFDAGYSFMDVLICARDNLHVGRELLTHPLSGSVKPYETPYKTILLSAEKGNLDIDGISIIESAIITADKFLKNRKELELSERVLNDFRLIDLSLIEEFLI